MAQYYKRYKVSGKSIILDWRLSSNDFIPTKDWVKDTLKATFKWNEKVWIVPYSTAMVELLCKEGWESEEDKEARDKASCDTITDAVIGDYPTPPAIPDITKVQLDMSKVPPEARAYQIEAVKWIEASNGSTLLAMPVGSGKTLQAVTWASQHSWDKPMLVICPAGLRKHWQNEFKKWARMKATIAYSTFKAKSITSNCEVIVTNFHILNKIKDELKGNISAIIVDEADMLSNESAGWTKAFVEINKTATSRLFLTGTPVRNNPLSIWNILTWINPTYWKDKADYIKRYCKMEVGYGGQLAVKDGKNLQELHSRVKPFMMYKSLEEILPDLPKINNTIYEIEGTEEYENESNAIMGLLEKHGLEDVSDLLDMENPDKELASILLRIEELSRTSYKIKREKCFEHIDEFLNESDESILLVANHHAVIDDLKLKYNCPSIDGRVNSNHRQAIVDRFNAGDNRVLVLNAESAGVGYSMHKCCRMFFVEGTYSARTLAQVMGRIRRLTSTSPIAFYYHFTVKDSIDKRMYVAVQKKARISSEILTGESTNLLENIAYISLD